MASFRDARSLRFPSGRHPTPPEKAKCSRALSRPSAVRSSRPRVTPAQQDIKLTARPSAAVTALQPLDSTDAGGGGTSLTIADAAPVLHDARLGDSICVNGTCLTVTELGPEPGAFKVGVAPETLRRTNLGDLTKDARVNLEPALLPGTRLGGHLLQGHVDTVARIAERRADGNAVTLRFVPDATRLMRHVVEKGFIAIDGASLTVTAVGPDWFEVMLIAYTQSRVVTAAKVVGDAVNIEVDQVAKYVEKSVAAYFEGTAGPGDVPALERIVERVLERKLAERGGP